MSINDIIGITTPVFFLQIDPNFSNIYLRPFFEPAFTCKLRFYLLLFPSNRGKRVIVINKYAAVTCGNYGKNKIIETLNMQRTNEVDKNINNKKSLLTCFITFILSFKISD